MRTQAVLLCAFVALRSHAQLDLVLDWETCLGGFGMEHPNVILPMPDGGCVVAGVSWSTFGPDAVHHGDGDFWVARLDGSGAMLWQRLLGGQSRDSAEGIALAPNGDIVVCGFANSISGYFGTLPGAVIVRFSPDGDIEWMRRYGGTGSPDRGSAFNEVLFTPDGGMLLSGATSDNDGDVQGLHEGLFGGYPTWDAWLVRTNATGDILWQRTLGGTATEADGVEVVIAADGNYVFATSTSSIDGDVSSSYHANGPSGSDIWVGKVSTSGDLLWERSIGGTGTEYSGDIITTLDGKVAIVGDGESGDHDLAGTGWNAGYIVARVSLDGTVIWAKKYLTVNAFGGFTNISQSLDGHYWLCGASIGEPQAQVLELGPGGYQQQAGTMGGSGMDTGMDIACTPYHLFVLAKTTGEDLPAACLDEQFNVWVMRFRNQTIGIEEQQSLASATFVADPASFRFSPSLVGGTLLITDPAGRLVFGSRISSTQQQVDITSLASGVYIATAERGHEMVRLRFYLDR